MQRTKWWQWRGAGFAEKINVPARHRLIDLTGWARSDCSDAFDSGKTTGIAPQTVPKRKKASNYAGLFAFLFLWVLHLAVSGKYCYYRLCRFSFLPMQGFVSSPAWNVLCTTFRQETLRDCTYFVRHRNNTVRETVSIPRHRRDNVNSSDKPKKNRTQKYLQKRC